MKEYFRTFEKPELTLKGELEGFGPVQGFGTVVGFPFYFRARHDEWSFAISENPDMDPVDIQLPEQGRQFGYFQEGVIGHEWEEKASHLDLAKAKKLIETCCKAYLSQKKG